MTTVIAPKLLELLKKIEKDDLADLQAALIPGLIEEIELLSPDAAKPVEAMVLSAIQPAAQAAFDSLIAKIPA